VNPPPLHVLITAIAFILAMRYKERDQTVSEPTKNP